MYTQKGTNSIIVVTNEMLSRQMQTYVDMYCAKDFVEIALINELTVPQCVGKAVLLDEADEMIELFPAHIIGISPKLFISGLAAANCAKKIYLLGATYDTYCEVFIDQILQVKSNSQYMYDSQQKINNEGILETNDDVEKFGGSSDEMLKELQIYITK